MTYVSAFFRFWYDFLLGDDWRIAAGVVVVLLLTVGTAHLVNKTLAAAVIIVGCLVVAALALRRSVRG
jgi:hypothetical protein